MAFTSDNGPTKTNERRKAMQNLFIAAKTNGALPFEESVTNQISIICSVDLFSPENKPGFIKIVRTNTLSYLLNVFSDCSKRVRI